MVTVDDAVREVALELMGERSKEVASPNRVKPLGKVKTDDSLARLAGPSLRMYWPEGLQYLYVAGVGDVALSWGMRRSVTGLGEATRYARELIRKEPVGIKDLKKMGFEMTHGQEKPGGPIKKWDGIPWHKQVQRVKVGGDWS